MSKERVSGRKRRRGFRGVQKQFLPAVDHDEGAVVMSDEEDSLAQPSASKRKMEPVPPPTQTGHTSGASTMVLRPRRDVGGGPSTSEPDSEADPTFVGNRIISCDSLVSSFEELWHCRDPKKGRKGCNRKLSISEDCVRGLSSRIVLRCECGWFRYISDPYDSSRSNLNRQSVLAMRLIGKGERSLRTFCAMMDFLPSVRTKAFATHVKMTLAASNATVRAEHLACADELFALHAEGKLISPPDIVDTETEEGGTTSNEGLAQDDDSCDESGGSGDDQSECESGDGSLDSFDGSMISDDDLSQGDESPNHSHSDPCDSEAAESGEGGQATVVPDRVWTTEPIDVTVTFDGTWSKRGHTAAYGVMVVMSWDTGRVLDSVVLSRHCGKCARKRKSISDDPEVVDNSLEFQQWFELHEPECTSNHRGTSASMEVEGALILWGRSVKLLNLRYVKVVSDSDSRAIRAVQDAKPYGEGVRIVKYECVGHVQKRVGAAISNLKKNPPTAPHTVVVQKATRGRKASKSCPAVSPQPEVTKEVMKKVTVGGQGGLTMGKSLRLQHYYGNAIRAHAGDLEGMVAACWAVYYHSISTDEAPQHQYCPKGPESWCKYNQHHALNPGAEPLPHLAPNDHQRLIPLRLAEYVKPIFVRLCDRKLLSRCVLGATQNQNESFNNLVWNRCSKTNFTSFGTVQLAVNLAILSFNRGSKSFVTLAKNAGLKPTDLCKSHFDRCDVFRVKWAEARATRVQKRRRRDEQRRRAAAEEHTCRAEGVSYQAGSF